VAFSRRRAERARPGENPFTERGFIAAAGVLTVVLVSGAAVLLTDPPPPATETDAGTSGAPAAEGDAGDGTETDDAAEPAGEPASPGDSAADGSCPELPAQDQARPSGEPPGTVWQNVDGQLLPFSPRVGPAQSRGPVARCYAHTPTGAVFAAVQASWRYRRSEDWGAMAQFTLAPGPGRDAYIRQRTDGAGPNGTPYRPPADDVGTPQPLGFRVVSYTPEQAEIDVISSPLSSGLGNHTVWSVVWSGNDWRLVLGGNGEAPPASPVKETDAFVAWDPASMASALPPGPDEARPDG
jgi:hypothetical protein